GDPFVLVQPGVVVVDYAQLVDHDQLGLVPAHCDASAGAELGQREFFAVVDQHPIADAIKHAVHRLGRLPGQLQVRAHDLAHRYAPGSRHLPSGEIFERHFETEHRDRPTTGGDVIDDLLCGRGLAGAGSTHDRVHL